MCSVIIPAVQDLMSPRTRSYCWTPWNQPNISKLYDTVLVLLETSWTVGVLFSSVYINMQVSYGYTSTNTMNDTSKTTGFIIIHTCRHHSFN